MKEWTDEFGCEFREDEYGITLEKGKNSENVVPLKKMLFQ